MLHPARLGVVLGELLLRHAQDVLLFVEDDGAAAGGALVQGDDVLPHVRSLP